MRACGSYPHPLEELLGGDEVHRGEGADPAKGWTPGGLDGSDEVEGGAGGNGEELGVGGGREGLMNPSPRPPCKYGQKLLKPDYPV